MVKALDDLILKIDDYFKSWKSRYVYCGSISLYLNGIKEITEFTDIDIDFLDFTEKYILDYPGFCVCNLPVDMLTPVKGIERKYHEINFHGRKLFISDLDYELSARELFVKDLNYFYRDKALKRIELLKRYI